jgi:hypothetical protein
MLLEDEDDYHAMSRMPHEAQAVGYRVRVLIIHQSLLQNGCDTDWTRQLPWMIEIMSPTVRA